MSVVWLAVGKIYRVPRTSRTVILALGSVSYINLLTLLHNNYKDVILTSKLPPDPSLRVMMANMVAMLTTHTTRLEVFEKKQVTQDDTATSHMFYTAQPEISISQAARSHPPARQIPAELDAYPDVTEEVRAQVAQHLRGAPAQYPLTDEELAPGDENVDIDLGYTNDHEFKSSFHQPWLMALRPSAQPMDSK